MIGLVLRGEIDPEVFDLTLPREQVAEGYRAMDERRARSTTAWVGSCCALTHPRLSSARNR